MKNIKVIVLIIAVLFIAGCTTYPVEPYVNPFSCVQVQRPKTDEYIKSHPTPYCILSPQYPLEAYEKSIDGYVMVEFDVNKKGQTYNLRVLESEPKGVFDEASLLAVKRSFYLPSDRIFKGVKRKLSFTMEKP